MRRDRNSTPSASSKHLYGVSSSASYKPPVISNRQVGGNVIELPYKNGHLKSSSDRVSSSTRAKMFEPDLPLSTTAYDDNKFHEEKPSSFESLAKDMERLEHQFSSFFSKSALHNNSSESKHNTEPESEISSKRSSLFSFKAYPDDISPPAKKNFDIEMTKSPQKTPQRATIKSAEKNYRNEIQEVRNHNLDLISKIQHEKDVRREDAQRYADQIEKLNQSLQEKDSAIEVMKQQMEDLRVSKRQSEEEILELIQDKTRLRENLNQLKEELKEREEFIRNGDKSKLQPLLEEYNKLIESIRSEKDSEIEELTNELDKIKLKFAGVEVAKRECEAQISKLQGVENEVKRYKLLLEKVEKEKEKIRESYEDQLQNLSEEKRKLADVIKNNIYESNNQMHLRERQKNEQIASLEHINYQLREEQISLHEQFRTQLINKEREIKDLARMFQESNLEEKVKSALTQINKEIRQCIGDTKTLTRLAESQVMITAKNKQLEKEIMEVEQGSSHHTALHNVLLLRKELETLKSVITDQYSLQLGRSNECATQ